MEHTMEFLTVLASGIAAYLMFTTGHFFLFILAIAVSMVCFWSWGITHNYNTKNAKRRSKYTGGFYDITDRKVERVPNWLSTVNVIFSLTGLALFILGIVFIIGQSKAID
jgi:hypothetical protein